MEVGFPSLQPLFSFSCSLAGRLTCTRHSFLSFLLYSPYFQGTYLIRCGSLPSPVRCRERRPSYVCISILLAVCADRPEERSICRMHRSAACLRRVERTGTPAVNPFFFFPPPAGPSLLSLSPPLSLPPHHGTWSTGRVEWACEYTYEYIHTTTYVHRCVSASTATAALPVYLYALPGGLHVPAWGAGGYEC